MTRISRHLPFLCCALALACATPQVAVNSRADFSRIRRVAVASFSGSGGEQASDMLLQDLLARGADVVERQRLDAVLNEQRLSSTGLLDPDTVKRVGKILGVDAIFVGSVSDMVPSQSYMVTRPGDNTVVMGTVTPVQGKGLYVDGPVPGMPDSQIITSAASVGVIARMVDVETGSVLWSARMSYEGLDTATAMGTITSAFADSMVPIWPDLHPL